MGRDRPVARLGWLIDGEFTVTPAAGPNRRAAEATVAHLCGAGLPEVGMESLVEGFVMLAEAVDADPTNAAVWSQYRAADAYLRGVARDGTTAATDGDGANDWTAPVTPIAAAVVRDPAQPGPRDARPRTGRGRPPAAEAVHAVAEPRRRRSAGA